MTTLIHRSHYPAYFGPIFEGPFNASDLTIVSSSSRESESGKPSSDSEEVAFISDFCPDKNTWIDIAWFRCEAHAANNAQLRLFWIDDGQSIEDARAAEQWITEWLYFSDITANTKVDFTMLGTTFSSNRARNKINAGGRIGVLFDEPPVGMTNGVIGLRVREARP